MRVLEMDSELLAAVPPDRQAAARDRLLARCIQVSSGPWSGGDLDEPTGIGGLILEGLLTRNLDVAGTRSREMLGAGDVIRPWDDDSALNPLPIETSWSVLEPTTIAVLDGRFLALAGHWPELGAEILHRILRRSRSLAVLLAIANFRGIEERVLLLLWHLAGNWGTVTASGTLVPFGLTHEVIAELVGARRPSVTTALVQMERDGKLERVGKGWLLHADPPRGAG